MTEWRLSTWGEEISLEYGKALRGYGDAKGPVPVYGTNGPVGWTDEPLAAGPGVILGRKGAYRGVHFSRKPFFVIDTAYYVVPKTELDMRWLYYAMIHHKLGEIDDGSPIPSTTRAAVYPRELEVPDIDEQKAIAAVLGSLDDKIELNQRMNETLEAMARAIFKSWFVDFDPVRAKMEGRDTGLATDVDPLFPERLNDEGLPEGWRTGLLGNVATDIRRGVQPDKIASNTAYIGLEHMPRQSIALTEWSDADGLGSNKFEFQKGDILFGKLRPYFHKVGIAPIDGVCSTDIVVVNSLDKIWHEFVLLVVSSHSFVSYTNSSSTGTRMPRTSWSEMSRYVIPLPSPDVMEAFSRTISPLLDRMVTNIYESRTLASLRDLLLPKLISGDVFIMDAEKLADEARA